MTNNLTASKNPIEDIAKITYEGQDPKRRMYQDGYESYFEQMPILDVEDPLFDVKLDLSKMVMQQLGKKLAHESWVQQTVPPDKEFYRTIVAMEPPRGTFDGWTEGAEFVVAHWGNGFTSPVHGHAPGYMHEEVLFGKVLVNTYRMLHPWLNKVRLIKSEIVTKGTFVSEYAPENPDNKFKRQALIHNFRSIGHTATLHYLPEHTRDGRDNRFEVEYFEELMVFEKDDLTQLTAQEGLKLKIGDVALVRSSNVPEYGDHYIVITGLPVIKEHGLRPQEIAIEAPKADYLLNKYEPIQGLTLLKLNEEARDYFLLFHNIEIIAGKVIFPLTK